MFIRVPAPSSPVIKFVSEAGGASAAGQKQSPRSPRPGMLTILGCVKLLVTQPAALPLWVAGSVGPGPQKLAGRGTDGQGHTAEDAEATPTPTDRSHVDRSDPSGHPALLSLKSVGCVVLTTFPDTKDLSTSEVWLGRVLLWCSHSWTDEPTSALCHRGRSAPIAAAGGLDLHQPDPLYTQTL